MMKLRQPCDVLLLVVLASACTVDRDPSSSGGAIDSWGASTGAVGDDGTTASRGEGDDGGDGTIGSSSATTGATAVPTTSVSDGSHSDGSTSVSTSGEAGDSTAGDETGTCGSSGGGIIEFSYIWIANSTQGTVSKIDTKSATEVGRYLVDDYEGASISTCQGPSRTSVNMAGDVAVLDRGGGLAKIFADHEDCIDKNGNGTIETSNGVDYLAWGEDECLAWQMDIPRNAAASCNGPRAVQWTAPEVVDEQTCLVADPKLWVAFCNAADDDVTVWLLDGADGSVEVEIPVAGYDCNTYGPYGGAVDANNNFYFVDRSSGQSLYRIEYGCTPVAAGDCWTEFAPPSGENAYGITIDKFGRIWIAGEGNSLYAFDTNTLEYTSHQAAIDAYFSTDNANKPADSNTTNTLRGLVADDEGVLWIASIQNGGWSGGNNPGLLRVDPTVDPAEVVFFGPSTLTGIQHAAGTSIDVEGYVWLVDTLGNQAFKIDPVTPNVFSVVSGLQYPYTYSDMTGFALQQIQPQ